MCSSTLPSRVYASGVWRSDRHAAALTVVNSSGPSGRRAGRVNTAGAGYKGTAPPPQRQVHTAPTGQQSAASSLKPLGPTPLLQGPLDGDTDQATRADVQEPQSKLTPDRRNSETGERELQVRCDRVSIKTKTNNNNDFFKSPKSQQQPQHQ